MHSSSPALSPVCPLVPTSMFNSTAKPLSKQPKQWFSAPGSPPINVYTVSLFLTAVQGGSARHGLWGRLLGIIAAKGHLDPKTYCSSILFKNNKSPYSKDVEEKCPQYFPFEMQSAGDQNLQYSIHSNSTDNWSQRPTNSTFGVRQAPWGISQNKGCGRID